jgi:hypothetical protein
MVLDAATIGRPHTSDPRVEVCDHPERISFAFVLVLVFVLHVQGAH